MDELQWLDSTTMTIGWTRTCAAFWVRRVRVLVMLCNMYLQERVVAASLAVRESWLLSVTPRFLTVWVGATTELSMVIIRWLVGEPFPGRKSSLVLSRLIFRWCQSDRQRFFLLPVFQIGEKRELFGCNLRSCGRKSHVSEWKSQESWYTERRVEDPQLGRCHNLLIW